VNNLNLPFAIDHANKERPSLTVLFSWISFALSVLSIALLPLIHTASPAVASISLFVICMTFYRMRHLDKLKISENSLELDGGPESQTPSDS
jgi:hypothetical protein